MTDREVAEIVEAAERLHPDAIERAREILNREVTLAEYRRFETERTARFAVVCAVVLLLCTVACNWAVQTFGPQAEQRAKQGGGTG